MAWQSSRILLLLAGIQLAIPFGCVFAQSAAQPVPEQSGHIQHPRLLLNRSDLLRLRSEIKTTHSFLWQRYLQDVPHMIGVANGTLPLEDVRYAGDLVPELAFTWLMTGDREYLKMARAQLLKLTDRSQWESEESLAYLVPSHFLFGMALGYDWLYDELTASERKQVVESLGREAERLYLSITKERIWWRNQYFQNHSYSNTCGLAFAAAALEGENSQSKQWLDYSKHFFDKVFELMPTDGGSLEGYAYAGYGGEYLLKYALLARDLFGKDYTTFPWMKNYSSYMIQGLLPYRTADEWVMNYGDGPRRGWTSTAQHLFVLARLYRDQAAQWMGKMTISLRPQGLGSHGWMMLLYYDPTVGEADPATFPTFKYFPEIDQTMMRSSWIDPEGTLVGFKCGPFMGKRLSREAVFDYGTGHSAPDAGAFQIFANRTFWAIDPLYPGYKSTGNYSTMLFKEVGQLGEQAGFGAREALEFKHYPEIVLARSTPGYDYVVGDVTHAYHPALGLDRFVRHLLFIKPDILLVADEVKLEPRGMVYNFPSGELKTEEGLKHAPNDYVVGEQGEAYTVFEGVPGKYQLTAVYLDNRPEEGQYSFEVDGKEIYRWKSQNENVDDHLIAVSPPVELKPGSKIAFRGAPMAQECRLVKLTAFSSEVPSPAKAQWLLQMDPKTEVVQFPDHQQMTLGDARLDLYPLAPSQYTVAWQMNTIPKPQELFTFRQTRRLVIDPAFQEDTTTLVNLIHSRKITQDPLENVKSIIHDRLIELSWERGNRKFSLQWDLAGKTVLLAP
ncbi:MAG: DUF4962 domain-containing protein [Candidatus Sulfotelmatobacter sp.]|jgi:hypothetical protein